MKRAIRLRFALCCAATAFAADAHAQLEGTLFTQPEERALLDYLREEYRRNNPDDNFNIQEVEIPEVPVDTAPAEDDGPAEYSFGAVMRRRDGNSIWLNGNLLTERELPPGFSLVESGRSVSLRVAWNDETVTLLPGQSLDMATGMVSENLAREIPVALPAAPTAEPEPPAPQAQPDSVEENGAGGDAAEAAESDAAAPALSAAAESGQETETETANADDTLASLMNALSELTPEEQEELARLMEAQQAGATEVEAADAAE